MTCVAFHIETEPFSAQFNDAQSDATRKKYAPKMRVACVYDEKENKHLYFEPHEADDLVRILQEASEVISFNGKRFDVLVLRRHYKLRGKVPLKGRHIDIHEILTGHAGFKVSLDKAVSINFGEKKHTDGRSKESLDIEELKEACRSDVNQTYRLWIEHNNGTLKNPVKSRRSRGERIDLGPSPGHHMPELCPNCHDVGSLEFIEWDTEEMTDGQFAEYIAGTQGSAICQSCGHEIDWYV